MPSRTFRICATMRFRLLTRISLGDPANKETPEHVECVIPMDLSYPRGALITLWRYNQLFWVDVCGCPYSADEIRELVRTGKFMELSTVRK